MSLEPASASSSKIPVSTLYLENLPDEALISIFKRLTPHDLISVSCTSTGLSSIVFDKMLRSVFHPLFMSKALKSALKIENADRRAEMLLELVKLQAKIDIEQAMDIVDLIQAPYWQCLALLETFRAEAKIDLQKALTSLKIFKSRKDQIQNYSELNHAILEEVRAISEIDVRIAKPIILRFNQALKNAALLEIIKIEVKRDLRAAKITLEAIDDPKIQALALLEVSREELKWDRQRALDTCQKAKAIILELDSLYNYDAFLELIKLESIIDLANAMATIQQTSDQTLQLEMRLEVAAIQAENDPRAAKEMLQIVKPHINLCSFIQKRAILKMIRIEAEIDPKSAKENFRTVSDETTRCEVQIELIIAEAKRDLLSAKAMIKEIQCQDPELTKYWQSRAQVEIVKIEKLSDRRAAIVTTRRICLSSFQVKAILELI